MSTTTALAAASCPWCGRIVGRSGHRCRQTPTAADVRPGDRAAGLASCRAALAAARVRAVAPAASSEQLGLDLEVIDP